MRLIDADAFKECMRSALEQTRRCYPDGGEWAEAVTEEFCRDIDEQPTVEPERKPEKWIPCSERLPERSIEVLTYTALVNLIEIQTLERDEHGFMYWENQHGDRQDMTVTAWMPLPEPYRGGDSE